MSITFKNAKLTDLRNTFNEYNRVSVYGAVMALGSKILGEIAFNNLSSESINIGNVSHSISNIRIVDEMIVGDVTILDTPAGNIVSKNLIRDGELVCGFSMTSIVEFNNIIHIVSFNIAPENKPITRNVNFTADIAPQNKSKIAVVNIESRKPCGNCVNCKCDENSDELLESVVYRVVQEPDRSVSFVTTQYDDESRNSCNQDSIETSSSDSSNCDYNTEQ